MIGLFFASIFATAQNDPNPVLTGAPFLRVSPDARSGALETWEQLPPLMHFHNIGTLQSMLSAKAIRALRFPIHLI